MTSRDRHRVVCNLLQILEVPVRGEILRVVSDTKTPVVLEIPPRTGVAVILIFYAGKESGRWIPLRALLGRHAE